MKKKNSRKPKRTILLAIGGGMYDFKSESETRLLRTTKFRNNTTKSKKQIEKDRLKWKSEMKFLVKSLNKLFESKKKKKSEDKLKVFKVIAPSLQPSYEENISLIKKFFSERANHYVLYWFGHGNPDNGNWGFNCGKEGIKEISCEFLLKLWRDGVGYKEKKHLIVIVDTCHSGKWNNYLKKANLSDVLLSMQFGCKADEKSFLDEEILNPSSLLMKKMLFQDHIWGISFQHPFFFISNKARRFTFECKDEKIKGENTIEVLPCFKFIEIQREWRVNESKQTVNFYNEKNSLEQSYSKKKINVIS